MREVTVVGVREWPARAVNKNSTQLNSYSDDDDDDMLDEMDEGLC